MGFKYSALKTYGRPEDLQKAVNRYFDKVAKDDLIPSMSGLGLEISASVKTLEEWSKLPEYGPILDEAFLRIENRYEQELVSSKNRTDGIQYALDNRFGWRSKKEFELGKDTRETMAKALPLSEKLKVIEKANASMLKAQQMAALMMAHQAKEPVVVDVEEEDMTDAD